MHCARERLLLILATCAVESRHVVPAERPAEIERYISEWRAALWDAYAGESVRFTLRKLPETRGARNDRILAALDAGATVSSVAKAESVSCAWVRHLRARNNAA